MLVRLMLLAVLAFGVSGGTSAYAYNGGCTDRTCADWNDEGPGSHIYRDYGKNLASWWYGLWN